MYIHICVYAYTYIYIYMFTLTYTHVKYTRRLLQCGADGVARPDPAASAGSRVRGRGQTEERDGPSLSLLLEENKGEALV